MDEARCRRLAESGRRKEGVFLSERDKRPGGMVVYAFRGYSMFPFLRPGDRLVVTKRAGTAIGPGDIVLFRDRGGPSPAGAALVAHRVIRRTPDGRFVTKGDNMTRSDPGPPTRREILGRVIAVIRKGRMRSLHGALHRLLGKAVARYSEKNLTPGLILSRLKAAVRR